MRRNIAIALAAVPSALLLTATPALASSSDGTVFINLPQTCFTFGNTTVCESMSGRFNTTTTPSGNVSLVGTNTFNLSATNGAETFSESLTSKGHFLDASNGTQESSGQVSQSYDINGQTCTFTQFVHYANGDFQFDRVENACPPGVA
jgi:hypothetical protein